MFLQMPPGLEVHPSLRSYFDEVEKGNIYARFQGELVLFNYTDKCTFNGVWNHWTKTARGRIYEVATGRLISACLPKFHNLFETFDHMPDKLPRLPFVVEEKADGSNIQCWHYKGKWHTSTRGAFDSEQAIKAKELLEKYNWTLFENVSTNVTVVCELVGPSNRIVVPYADDELVLLTVFDRDGDYEWDRESADFLAEDLMMNRPKVYDYTLDDIIGLRDTLPKYEEGWVVRYANNFRIKVKGAEYLKLAKLISRLSPLAVWEVMDGDTLPDRFVMDYPEELRPELEDIHARMVARRRQVRQEIMHDRALWPVPESEVLAQRRKQLGLWLKGNAGKLRHPSMVFPVLLGDDAMVEKYVRDATRPTSNIIAD